MKFSSLMPAGALVIAGVAAGCSGGYSGPSGPDSLRIAAASVHLKGGANSQPTFADNGLSLTTNGALSGLGNVDLLVTLNATANVTANCTNHGGNLPPGGTGHDRRRNVRANRFRACDTHRLGRHGRSRIPGFHHLRAALHRNLDYPTRAIGIG